MPKVKYERKETLIRSNKKSRPNSSNEKMALIYIGKFKLEGQTLQELATRLMDNAEGEI